MDGPLVGGLLAFAGGAAVAALNYFINLGVLKKRPDALASVSIVRQVLNVAYLVCAFFLSRVLPWDAAPLLIGAALGLTIPSILLAMRLAKVNDAMNARTEEKSPGKGDEPHG